MKSQRPSMRLWENGWRNYLYLVGSKSIDTTLEGKGGWEFDHKKTDLCWLWFSSSRFSWNPVSFEEVLWWVELFKPALGDCSTVTGMNYLRLEFCNQRTSLSLWGSSGYWFWLTLIIPKEKRKKAPNQFFLF